VNIHKHHTSLPRSAPATVGRNVWSEANGRRGQQIPTGAYCTVITADRRTADPSSIDQLSPVVNSKPLPPILLVVRVCVCVCVCVVSLLVLSHYVSGDLEFTVAVVSAVAAVVATAADMCKSSSFCHSSSRSFSLFFTLHSHAHTLIQIHPVHISVHVSVYICTPCFINKPFFIFDHYFCRCTPIFSATCTICIVVLLSQACCPSVRLSVCNVDRLRSHSATKNGNGHVTIQVGTCDIKFSRGKPVEYGKMWSFAPRAAVISISSASYALDHYRSLLGNGKLNGTICGRLRQL